MVSVNSDENTPDSHNETLTSHHLTAGGEGGHGGHDADLSTLLSLLRLQPVAQHLLANLLSDGTANEAAVNGAELMPPLTNELHSALLESSKTCLNLACPLIAHLCTTVRNSLLSSSEPVGVFNNKSAEFCANALLELIPSVVVATFLYGSTSHSLLDTTGSTGAVPLSSIHHLPQPPHSNSSVPPSPTVNTGTSNNFQPPTSSPSASIRQVLSTLTSGTPSSASTHQHISPEYLLQFVLSLIANGSLMSLANSLNNQHGGTSRQSLRPTSGASRLGAPNSPPPPHSGSTMGLSGPPQPAIHHFASLVAPSIYHNPVLFGAAIVSDNAQTEHHQHERRVRIQTAQSPAPVASIIANFHPNPAHQPPLQPGMVAPLAMAALSDFNRHYAVQLTGGGSNVNAIVRGCDAALRLLALPISSPSLQSVSPGIVLQFVYFVSIASGGAIRSSGTGVSNNDGVGSASVSNNSTVASPSIAGATSGGQTSLRACRKCSTSSGSSPPNKEKVKVVGVVSFDLENDDKSDDSSSDDEIADEKQLCRLKLLQVLHAARNLAELRLWPDVLAVIKAVKNTSGLGLDLGEGAEGVIELVLSHPTSVRAITNASFKARKLPDDIEAMVDQKEVASPGQKRAHGHQGAESQQQQQSTGEASSTAGSKRSGHHHHTHHGISAANQFTSHWRAGKHSAAIASLQAAFRLPERLRSRRRSFGPEVVNLPSGSATQQGSAANNSGTSNANQAPTPSAVTVSFAAAPMHRGSTGVLASQAGMVTVPSFSFEPSVPATPVGPRLEMRILDNPNSVSNSLVIEGIEETAMDERHPDLPMIDDGKAHNGSSDSSANIPNPNTNANTPRSRTNSLGQQQRPSTITSALSSFTRTGRS